MTDIDKWLVVVTGASSGMGKSIAIELAPKVETLYLVARNSKNLESVAQIPRRGAANVRSFKADLLLDEDIEKLRDDIQRNYGYLDVLIHSASVISMGKLEHASVDDLDRQYRTNVRAPYLLTQALLPMLKSRGGQVVFINSSAGLNAKPEWSQYAATKHALKAIADSLRAEVNRDGIRVLSVYPGRTATPMQEAVHKMEGKAYHPERFMLAKDVSTVIINALTLPRSAEVTDIHIRPFKKFD